MIDRIYPPYATIPPEVPKSECCRLHAGCPSGTAGVCNTPVEMACNGETAVTTSFIRGRGVPTYFDNPPDPRRINNPSPVPIFVRIDENTKQFILNGKVSPRLVLQRGGKYQINIVTGCCPFYFSTKPGGSPDIFGIPPVEYDLRTYVIGDKVPSKFYYTSVSGASKSLVGEVVVV